MPPKKPPARLAAPVARSSRLAWGRGSPFSAKARPAAMLSVKLISAMPSAPGQSSRASDRSGITSCGSPAGIGPTMATPAASRPSHAETAMATPTAMSGAGDFGRKCSSPTRMPIVTAAMASVGVDRWGSCATIATRLCSQPALSMCTPRNFGSWSTTTTRPMPALNPTSTGSEMNLARKPSRRRPASTRKSAGERGERGCGDEQRFGRTVRRHLAELRRGEDGERRRGAHAERARASRARRTPPSARRRCRAPPAPGARRWSRRPSPSAGPPPPW